MSSDKCRICLVSIKRNKTKHFKNVFANMDLLKEIKLADAIMDCASVNIDPDDGYPKLICQPCICNLETSYQFRQTCRESDNKLRNEIFTKEEVPDETAADDWGFSNDDSDTNFEQKYEAEHIKVESIKYEESNDELSSEPDNAMENQADKFPCTICGKCYLKRSSLASHMRLHARSDFPQQCTLCFKNFSTKWSLRHHFSKTHPHSKFLESGESSDDDDNINLKQLQSIITNEPGEPMDLDEIRCSKCPKKFSKKNDLTLHLKNHLDEAELKCGFCDIEFHDIKGLRRHNTTICSFQKNDFKLPYVCSACNKILPAKHNFLSHLRTHTNERPFTCTTCNQGFKQIAHLSMHKRVHTGEKPFECSKCHHTFTTNSSLKKHIKSRHKTDSSPKEKTTDSQNEHSDNSDTEDHNTKETKLECQVCSRRFFRKKSLKKHMLLYHPELDEPQNNPDRTLPMEWKCRTCSEKFTDRNDYVSHLAGHAKEMTYMCEECGTTFKTSSQLNNHKRTHSSKSFLCPQCPKKFNCSAHLKEHGRSHTDELPHQCSICGLRFKWRATAWRHRMYHTGEKPQKCEVCGKTFLEAGQLRRHMRVHTNERPQICSICFRAFKESTHLKTHIQLVHKDFVKESQVEKVVVPMEAKPEFQVNVASWYQPAFL